MISLSENYVLVEILGERIGIQMLEYSWIILIHLVTECISKCYQTWLWIRKKLLISKTVHYNNW